MRESKWELLLGRLLPAAVRFEAFDPARHDLRAERLLAGRGALWHRWQLLRLYFECWQLVLAPVTPVRPTERTISMLQDLRYALRSCRREPGFAAFAMLTLALGIGAMTMMYSVIHNVLLNPFPYTDPRGMVDVIIRNTADGGVQGGLSSVEFRALVDESQVFEDAAGANSSMMLYRSANGLEPFSVVGLTPNSFRFLGVPSYLGRAFSEADEKNVVVLNYRVWMTYFGGDPGVVGRGITLGGKPMTVIGVMPSRFEWNNADVWIPDPAERGDPEGMKKGFWLQGRLKRGVTMSQAESQLNVIAHRLAQLYPERYPKQFAVSVLTIIDWVVGRFRAVLYTLFGAVGLLLLIACCNVANMLLARATIRARAQAIRAALGASRFRMLQQSFLESLVLAVGGCLLGVAFAYAGLAALKPFIPQYGIARETHIEINGAVLLFSVVASTLTALVFGVAPVIRNTRRDVAFELAGSGKGTHEGSARQGGFRNVLIVSEVALCLVLLCGAGVLMKSFVALLNQDLGFDAQNLVTTRVGIPDATAAEKQRFFKAARELVAGLPGVVAVGITSGFPAQGGSRTDFDIVGKVRTEPWKGRFETCDEGYFPTLGIRMQAGAAFSSADIAAGRPVAIVNETFRNRYFGGEDPLGRMIRLERLNAEFQVIGVARDVRNNGIELANEPEVFVPYTATSFGDPRLLIRTAIDPRVVAQSLRPALAGLRNDLVFREPVIVKDELARGMHSRPRFTLILMTVFGLLGLLLVATGVYGVMNYVVSRQVREIGIRMALGAQRGQISAWVFGGAFRLIGVGLALGVVASIGANRVIASQLWAVETFDPLALAGAVVMIAMVGAGACLRPVLRATQVEPSITLRQG